MKRKLTSAFIDEQPVPASSLRCLHYQPPGLAVFSPPRDVLTSGNIIGIGLTGSGKTCSISSFLDGITLADKAWGIICNAVPYRFYSLQHIKKGRVS
ncbi:hypothetical protein PCO86_22360 (plasmid) [Pectobacteriaceae bacterium CE70]|nr:hypothetical protein [Prodigiosinella sp. LS101]WJV60592.1 hypothetical protein PCO84_22860 [Pectobacteriaceae bacterium C111]WJV64872.1 hypothetical protein PCO87_23060 [Pectobacteriaceae bacterium C52]WJV69196.1 hypothetical protein PCO86_22360 [Pectobacteriaceae bacterium CE70]WJY13123.1 hypothetical protein PCO80_22525 [Pectobacteriaceae bacterium C80]WJY17416.1 hypothetical protein PCO82_22720 [Pectobacteriaceae bacterium CE90]